MKKYMKSSKKEDEKENYLKTSNKLVKKISHLAFIITMTSTSISKTAYASEVVTSGLENLNNLFMGIVTSIGGMLALWGILELAISMSSNDGTSMSGAVKRIAGGIIATLAPTILLAILP